MRHLSTLVRIVLLAFVVFLSGVLMVKSSPNEPPIPQEQADLVSGYGYVRFLDYRLNPEQPPLGKALLALPLIFQDPSFPINSLNWQRDINNSQEVGRQFFEESGNDPVGLLNAGRTAPIILTLILILAVYFVSKELIGKWWALLPTFLFAFFPTALAYGHYATTTAASTLAIFLAITAFLNFLNKPAKKNLLLASITFGLAQLTTFAALILIPFFLFILFIFYMAGVVRDLPMTGTGERWHRFGLRAFRYFRALFFVFTVGFLLVFAVYLLLTLRYPIEKQFSDTTFLLEQSQPRWLSNSAIQLSDIPVLRAIGHYLLGIALNWPKGSAAGHSLLAGTFLKTPLAILALVLISAIYSLMNIGKACWSILRRRTKNFSDYLNTNLTEFAMLVFVGSYWADGLVLGANGPETMLPTIPFLFILVGGGIKKWAAGAELAGAKNLVLKVFLVYEEFVQISLKSALLAALLICYFITALIAYPHFSSFSNLIAGRPSGISDISDSQP